jgi:hypothetical protein
MTLRCEAWRLFCCTEHRPQIKFVSALPHYPIFALSNSPDNPTACPPNDSVGKNIFACGFVHGLRALVRNGEVKV